MEDLHTIKFTNLHIVSKPRVIGLSFDTEAWGNQVNDVHAI